MHMKPARELLQTERLASKKIAILFCLILVVVAEVIGVLVVFPKLDLSPSVATATPVVAAYLPTARLPSRAEELQSSTGVPLSMAEATSEREPSALARITWQMPQSAERTSQKQLLETNRTANSAYRTTSAISKTSNPTHSHQLPVSDPLPSSEPPASKYGYVMAEHFWDQHLT